MISSTHLHAMVVHFPVALLLAGFFSEVIGVFTTKPFFKQAALYMLILGSAGLVTAWFSGSAAGAGTEPGALGTAMELHEQAAEITLLLAFATLSLRIGLLLLRQQLRWTRPIEVILYLFIALAVARTGYLGGQLVFKHAAGVELQIGE